MDEILGLSTPKPAVPDQSATIYHQAFCRSKGTALALQIGATFLAAFAVVLWRARKTIVPH